MSLILWFSGYAFLHLIQFEAILISQIVNLFIDLLNADLHFIRDRLDTRYSFIAILVFSEILVPEALVDFIKCYKFLCFLIKDYFEL